MSGMAYAVAAGRRRAEAMMRDACTIARTAEDVTDPTTGVTTAGASTVVYAGKCRVKPAALSSQSEGSTREVTTQRFPYVVSYPMDEPTGSTNDVVTITAAVDDPSLVGVALVVISLDRGTDVTSRRLGCKEVNR